MTLSEIRTDIEEIHEQACKDKQDGYIDPDTGYWVFSRFYHEKRGKCCGNLCRHCPYEHINVKASRLEKERIKKGENSRTVDQNTTSYISSKNLPTAATTEESVGESLIDDQHLKLKMANRRNFSSSTSLWKDKEMEKSI